MSIKFGWLRWVALALALAAVAAPILLMLFTSVKSQQETFANPLAFPVQIHLENFARAWTVGDIPTKALNSLIVTISAVAISTVAGAAAGYVCARIQPRWLGRLLTTVFAFGLFIPLQSALVPLFTEMRALQLLGTLWPMILINAALSLPLSVLIFSSFFAALPLEIEESASIDGASRIRILFAIIVPLARPAFASSLILTTVSVWNDYFISLVFAITPSIQTLPVGLASFKVAFSTDWPATLAYSSMIAVPILLLYVALQKYITDGVTAGAIK